MKNETICRMLYKSLTICFIFLFCYAIIAIGHAMTYDIDNNNCTHMSRQLEGMFEKIGIPVSLKSGSNGDGRHMWIKIGILELDSVSLLPYILNDHKIDVVEYKSFDEYEKTR